jgi:glucan biosynthesis protein C
MASAARERRAEALRRRFLGPVAPSEVPDASGRETTAPAAKPRYHAIDALRGMAMFLVISLHAALGYITRDIPGVLWCVRDAPVPALPVFDWFCWWCMGVSNPLYFTIAGFFAVHLYDARGLRSFAANRARRVLAPFLAALILIGPACLWAWMYGFFLMERCTFRQIRKLRFADPEIQGELWGPGHLWFLEYLLWMLAAYAAFRWWGDRRRGGRAPLVGRLERVLASRWRPLLLALPTTALLWIGRQRLGIDAVLDRHNAFVPDPVKFLHHATFFAVGAGLYRLRHELLDRLARVGPAYLALSVPIFAGRAWLLGRDWTTPLHGPGALALAVLGALFGWLVVFGFIGLFLRLFRRSSPTISYLADSSYWIYLIHMPVLGLIQDDLFHAPIPAPWKFSIVWTLTLAIGFASYQTLVRYTAIGAWLHGRRARPTAPVRGSA